MIGCKWRRKKVIRGRWRWMKDIGGRWRWMKFIRGRWRWMETIRGRWKWMKDIEVDLQPWSKRLGTLKKMRRENTPCLLKVYLTCYKCLEMLLKEPVSAVPPLYHIVSSQKIKRKLTFQLSPYTNRSPNHYTYVPVLLVAYIFLKGAEF